MEMKIKTTNKTLKLDTTTYPPEWLKLQVLTIPSFDKDVKQWASLYIANRNIKWYSHFGIKLGSFLWN